MRIINVDRTNERRKAAYCLQLAGGGWTVQQTAKSMQYLEKLDKEGSLTVGQIKLVLVDPEEVAS